VAQGDPDAYDQGVIAGKIEARLAGHDKHFADLNGSVKDLAGEVHTLNLGIQRLMDSAAADRATVLTTAQALKDADDARRSTSETHWTPLSRVITVIAALAVVTGVIIAWASLHKGAAP
jgi:hypothetical protein